MSVFLVQMKMRPSVGRSFCTELGIAILNEAGTSALPLSGSTTFSTPAGPVDSLDGDTGRTASLSAPPAVLVDDEPAAAICHDISTPDGAAPGNVINEAKFVRFCLMLSSFTY